MDHSNNHKSFPFNRPGKYRIRVLGSLEESWSEKLAGLHITRGSFKGQSVTELSGPLRDQAELAGVLNTLYEMHLQVLLVEYQNE